MSSTQREEAARALMGVLPGRAMDLARLQRLVDGCAPVVTVIGKYNHGKSSLLNELIGQDAFAVSDKRETVSLSDSQRNGVRWLDAPGLDADVGTDDDRHALHAAWLESDIRLFVHAAKEGELDAKELELLAELQADGARTTRQTVFVLSQVDQLADDTELHHVSRAIDEQVPGIVLNTVSSVRHRKGIEGGKKLLLERSGIPVLHDMLNAALLRVPTARVHETQLLFSEIGAELHRLKTRQQELLDGRRETQTRERSDFDRGLQAVLVKVGADIEAMLDALTTNHAEVPDTAKDAYAITAGKRERAYLQIAYSRACIEIDSFLAGHGVTGLPSEQQTVARALNSVMIAVMGVSVKFRKDLHRMFCEPAGRERLQGEFAHYYELSTDRQALRKQIADAEIAVAASNKASMALDILRDAR